MHIFELANPSDFITFEAPDLAVATFVSMCIGEGMMAADEIGPGGARIENGIHVPFFIFGGHDEFCTKHFNMNVNEFISGLVKVRKNEVITALRSLMYGESIVRQTYNKSVARLTGEGLTSFMAAFEKIQNDKRTSTTDYRNKALSMAAALEAN